MEKDIDYLLWLKRENELPHPPYSSEREFYDYVAEGNTAAIEELRRKYGNAREDATEKGQLSEDPLRNAVYHMIVNCTIITRRCIAAGMPQEEAYSLSDIFIRRADACRSTDEVARVNDDMSMEFARRMEARKPVREFSPTVSAALRFMSDNLHRRLTAEEIAAEVGCSRSHFSSVFSRQTGMSLTECLRKMRISEAERLISEGVAFSDAACSLGFSSQSHFCRCFKRETGVTPMEFRREKTVIPIKLPLEK